jgi:hypothetical protein
MILLYVKCSCYRPGVAQKVGRGIALLFHDCGTRRGWVVSSTPQPYFTPGNDPVPIVQEAGWAPGPVWTGGKSCPTGIQSPDRPAHSQLLYRLSYPAHLVVCTVAMCVHLFICRLRGPVHWDPLEILLMLRHMKLQMLKLWRCINANENTKKCWNNASC